MIAVYIGFALVLVASFLIGVTLASVLIAEVLFQVWPLLKVLDVDLFQPIIIRRRRDYCKVLPPVPVLLCRNPLGKTEYFKGTMHGGLQSWTEYRSFGKVFRLDDRLALRILAQDDQNVFIIYK